MTNTLQRQFGDFPLCLNLTLQLLLCSLLKPSYELHPNCIILKLHHQISFFTKVSFTSFSTFCISINIYLWVNIEKDRPRCFLLAMHPPQLRDIQSFPRVLNVADGPRQPSNKTALTGEIKVQITGEVTIKCCYQFLAPGEQTL